MSIISGRLKKRSAIIKPTPYQTGEDVPRGEKPSSNVPSILGSQADWNWLRHQPPDLISHLSEGDWTVADSPPGISRNVFQSALTSSTMAGHSAMSGDNNKEGSVLQLRLLDRNTAKTLRLLEDPEAKKSFQDTFFKNISQSKQDNLTMLKWKKTAKGPPLSTLTGKIIKLQLPCEAGTGIIVLRARIDAIITPHHKISISIAKLTYF